MAKLYRLYFEQYGKTANADSTRAATYYTTRTEAEQAELIRGTAAAANPGEGRWLIREIELDELELRQAAANWLNRSEAMRLAAFKREAKKTAEQRSENMRKAWKTRKNS